MLTFSTKKKKSPIKSMLGFSAMVAAIASILFMNSRPIDVDGVKKRLTDLTAELGAQAGAAGKTVSFTYGTLELLGVGYEKYVQVNDPVLVIGDASDPQKHFSVSTSKVTVGYDPVNDRRFIFKFTEPLLLNRFGKKSIIKHEKPIKFGFFQKEFSEAASDRLLTIRMPQDIDFETPLKNNPQAKIITNLMFESMPELSYKITQQGAQSDASFELRNISANVGDNEKSNIGAVAGSVSETKSPEGKFSGSLNFTVSDFIHQLGNNQARTCSLTSNIGYKGAASILNVIGLPKASIDGKVNKFVLSCDDFSVKAEGELSLLADEEVPAGAVKISIENLKRFMASDLWPLKMRNELPAAMAKITGQPNDAKEDVSFDIKRDKGGKLMIGAVSFEESGLTMPLLVSDGTEPEPVPAVPAATESKEKPSKPDAVQEAMPQRIPESREVEVHVESADNNEQEEGKE